MENFMPFNEEDKAHMEDFETNTYVTENNIADLEKLYGACPEANDIPLKPTNHSQEEAIDGSLNEDEGVVFDEVS